MGIGLGESGSGGGDGGEGVMGRVNMLMAVRVLSRDM